MSYHVYILRSESAGRYYIGQTGNLKARLKRHQSGYEKSTRGRGPWQLYFSVEVENRTEAVRLERKLKGMKSRKRIEKWVAEQKRTD